MDYTSLRLYKSTLKKLHSLQSKHNYKNSILIGDDMVNFFEDEGISPKNRLDNLNQLESLRRKIDKRLDYVVGFLNEQESRFIKPMHKMLESMGEKSAVYSGIKAAEKEDKITSKINEYSAANVVEKKALDGTDILSENIPKQTDEFKKKYERLKDEIEVLIDRVEMKRVEGHRGSLPVIGLQRHEYDSWVDKLRAI